MKFEEIKKFKTIIAQSEQTTAYFIGSALLGNLHKIKELKEQNISSFLLLSDTIIFNLYGKKVVSSLEKLGKKVTTSLILPGEKQKNFSAVYLLTEPFFKAGFDKNACLVALGGGVITDLGGFVASILLRGIPAIYLPTTLLGQIDAAIGGKTGVDIVQGENLMLKNMIGTITQPRLVISDLDTLGTLPRKEILNGLGELVKYWIGWGTPDQNQLSKVENGRDKTTLSDCIEECQKIKLNLVQQDPLDTKGIRQKLNLGHTIGHAIEAASGGKLSHGQAVSIGLVATAKISFLKGFLPEESYQKIVSQLKQLGLPTGIKNINKYKVNQALKLDKKAGTYVLIRDIGNLVTGINVEKELVNQVLEEVIL